VTLLNFIEEFGLAAEPALQFAILATAGFAFILFKIPRPNA
jgi:hypothetical protein